MKLSNSILCLCALLCIQVSLAAISPKSPAGLMIPLYIYPAKTYLDDCTYWKPLFDLRQKLPKLDIIAIVNIQSGPGNSIDPNYAKCLPKLKAANIKVIGYVFTRYCDLAKDTRASVLKSMGLPYTSIAQDIDRWYNYFGSILDGIFFDEMWAEKSTTCESLLKSLHKQVVAKGGYTIGNPGMPTDLAYKNVFNNLVIWERGTYPDITSSTFNSWRTVRDANTMMLHDVLPVKKSILEACGLLRWIYTTATTNYDSFTSDLCEVGAYVNGLVYNGNSKCSYQTTIDADIKKICPSKV